jgi:hypothetical protein
VDEEGDWQPSIKTTICTPREEGLPVAYLCGLLNSELLDLWYAVRGKRPRDVWRNYEPKPMAPMPYRHVRPPASADEAPRLAQLEEALEARDSARARALADAIAAELSADPEVAGEAAAVVERLVRAIAHNRRELLGRRPLVRGLDRAVKDPWRTGPVTIDASAVVARLTAGDTVSVRLDPELSVELDADGPLGAPSREEGALVFRQRRRVSARVTGSVERLDLLEELLTDSRRLMSADLEATLLPKDLGAFADRLSRESTEAQELLDEGRTLVEAVERLVCRLYGLPPDLEEAVIEHAARRAAAGVPEAD